MSDELDARRYRALRALMEGAVGAYIEANTHKLVYENTPSEWGAFHIQFYPDTPVGFCTLGGATFGEMADAVLAREESCKPVSYKPVIVSCTDAAVPMEES